jgi:hypothetical protein
MNDQRVTDAEVEAAQISAAAMPSLSAFRELCVSMFPQPTTKDFAVRCFSAITARVMLT